MKTEHQQRVEEFMKKAEQVVPDRPMMRPAEILRLRANLILEEALETIEAMGFEVVLKPFDCAIEIGAKTHEPDLVKIVDGCGDLSVVTTGTLSALGVKDKPVLEAVDANNLAKFGPGSYKRESDGKWMKPPDHKAPDIMGLLILQGYGDKYFGQPEHAAPGFNPG